MTPGKPDGRPTYREALAGRTESARDESLAVICNVTLEPVFRDFLYYYDPHTEVSFCEPAAWLAEPPTERVVCLLRLQELCPRLYDGIYTMPEAEQEAELARALALYEQLAAVWRMRRTVVLLFLPERDPGERVPCGLPSFNRMVERLNRRLGELAETCPSLTMVSADRVLAREGFGTVWDRRGLYAFGAPYTPAGCRALARETAEWLYALRQPPRKCLVLDCDNVLWGGVAAEEGPTGVRLGGLSGRAYRDFQREVVRLWAEGVLLCLCSKNEEAVVWEMFDRHPDMLLRREHIAAARINFESKADNLLSLAEELGLPLDSMVFADDSDYEIGLCRHRLPEVAVLPLPADRPERFVPLLRECGLFDRLRITEEDRSRGRYYRDDVKRRRAAVEYPDEASYTRFLQTKVEIRPADEWDIPRIAELSARTHQCNLANTALTEAELERLCRSASAEVLALRASDVFGDMGLVAACLLIFSGEKAVIEGFWMSCRVLARGFEQQLLETCRNRAAVRGCALTGRYCPNGRNGRFASFYLENGVPLLSTK